MKSIVIIRKETPTDYRAVEEVTREAFWNQNVPGCQESFYIHSHSVIGW